MKKARLSVYLDKDILDGLQAYAARHNQSLSLIAEASIAAFVNPDEREAALIKRFVRLERSLLRLERDNRITGEALMVFVRFWLTTAPPLPEPAQLAANATSAERYEAFMRALGQRLAKGPAAWQEIESDSPNSGG
ncbi:CopG family transcriptional regulator [Asticcacaulis endophyticus]|nr:CopG family transcriptional regulator [Asticcacaulis endophyticus]